MLKIAHTEYPPCRKHEGLKNEIKKGGLWFCDSQQELAREAKRIVNKNVFKRKDEVKEFAKIFWIVFGAITAGLLLLMLVK